jgi:hypothetical protein
MATSPESIDDLLPGLKEPLWEGTDEEFTAYVRDVFGIPHTITTIMITPRGRAGRSAVAIGGQAGAIIFALASNGRRTQITPIVAGPLLYDNADVVARAARSDGLENMRAVTALAVRHLPKDVVLDLLTPTYH